MRAGARGVYHRRMVRLAVVAGVVVAGWASTASAEACGDVLCPGDPRWSSVELRTASPVPPDGAFVLEARRGRPVCLAEVDPHLTVTVRREGIGVLGEVAQMEGLPDVFIWRPTEMLADGATYEILVEVDNAGMSPDDADETCGPDRLRAQFFVDVGGDAGQVPTLMAPHVYPAEWFVEDFRAMACCPGSEPAVDSCSGAPMWYSKACWSVYAYTWLYFYSGFTGGTDGVRTQFAAQVVIDDEVVGRAVIGDSNDYDLVVFQQAPTCARTELVHVRTGEVVSTSEVTCPQADLVAMMGARVIDVTKALDCGEAVMCGKADGWGDACVPFDASMPPALPPLTSPYPYAVVCEAASVPADVSDDPEAPLAAEEGCGCTAVSFGPGVLCLPMLLRRRRCVAR